MSAGPEAPAGVVFDLGNVLIEWQPELAVAAGVGVEEARRFMSATDFDFMAYNHLQDAGGDWDQAEAEVARTHPHWAEHARAYRTHFVSSLVGEVPGSAAVVRDLHAAGVPMWGLTNWSHELYPHAPERYEVLRYLESVVVSGTERVAKPDPRIFEITIARTGLAADALVFVDDRADNVEADRRAGMDGFAFTGAEALRHALRERGLLP